MAPRWRKVWHDLWDNKLRTLLVLASILIGVHSVGMTLSLYFLVSEDMQTSYDGSFPYHAQIYTAPFDEDLLNSIRRVPGVAEADARRQVPVRAQVAPDTWLPMTLTAVRDFRDMRISRLRPVAGKWPPDKREILIERSYLPFSRHQIGDTITIELGDGTLREASLVGTVFDNDLGPASGIQLYGYVTYDTLEWLHADPGYDQLYLTVSEGGNDKAHIQEIANRVSDRIRESGGVVAVTIIPEPGRWIAASQILGVIAVLAILGILSIFLAGFLIFNTLSGLLAQHVKQIGVMKAIGARTKQIVGMYVTLVLCYSVLAMVVAVPLSAKNAHQVATFLGQQMNYDTLGFRVVPQVIAVQIIVGIAVPLVAGMVPVLAGARITIREAIGEYGLSGGRFGSDWVDRLVERIRSLSRPLLISLRNAFRRKGRMALTLLTLTLGGAIFIGVFSLRASLFGFIDQIGNYFLADVNLQLTLPYPRQEIEERIAASKDVAHVEGWVITLGELVDEQGDAFESVTVFGLPSRSSLVQAALLRGRWLLPGDENAIVVSNAVWRVLPDLAPGAQLRLAIEGREDVWTVVGIFQFANDFQLWAYTNQEYLARTMSIPGRASSYRVITHEHTRAAQQRVARQLQASLEQQGYDVSNVETGSMMQEANASSMNAIIYFFLLMAFLIALVGAVGLTGTMSMNVLERTREIGVMRAIGATDRVVTAIVLAEGVLIGLLSWALGSALSIPISRAMFSAISLALFRSTARFAQLSGFRYLACSLYHAIDRSELVTGQKGGAADHPRDSGLRVSQDPLPLRGVL